MNETHENIQKKKCSTGDNLIWAINKHAPKHTFTAYIYTPHTIHNKHIGRDNYICLL